MPPRKIKGQARAKAGKPRRRKQGNGAGSNKGSAGGAFTTQPRQLGNQLDIGKIPLFPPRYRCSLRYADTITLSSTTGAVASYVYSANGLYDPDITGTGHQPAGFDSMMLSFEHYTVVSARMTATFHNNTASVQPTAALGLNASSTPTTTVTQLIEDGLITTVRMNGNGVYGCVQTLQRTINIGKFGGVPSLLSDSNYRGSVAGNPAEQSYFHLQLWNTELSTSSSAVDVQIEYIAVFTEPRKLTSSLRKSLHALVVEEAKSLEHKVPEVTPGPYGVLHVGEGGRLYNEENTEVFIHYDSNRDPLPKPLGAKVCVLN